MKIWQNLLEPHEPDCHTFLRPLVKICQIVILFSLLVKICQSVILFQSPQNLEDFLFRDEISESYFKMSNPIGVGASCGSPEGRSCELLK